MLVFVGLVAAWALVTGVLELRAAFDLKRDYHAYGYVKKAAALVNAAAGRLAQWKANAIVRAADEAIAGKPDEQFPLCDWQTGEMDPDFGTTG